MNQKYFIKFIVEGYKEELSEFMRLLAYIERCGTIGHSGTIHVNVDGDGTGRLKFETFDDTNLYKNVYENDDIKEIDNKDQNISIGE